MSEDTFKLIVENHPEMKLPGLENVVHDISDEKSQILLDGDRWKTLNFSG